jgi:6-pyruvoyltetrahydropterin/6-carboxytetrahydropterin synthase
MHGHNYRIDVRVSSPELDARGFVLDFAELDELVMPIVAKLDHRTLNDIDGLANPTAEIIGAHFAELLNEPLRARWCKLDEVVVHENVHSCAVVRIKQ